MLIKPLLNTYLELYYDNPDDILARQDLVKEYSWAVPNEVAIKTLLKYSPIVEMGAGTGYWAYLLRAAGGDVVAYDRVVDGAFNINVWHPSGKMFTEITKGEPQDLARHNDRSLFLCWPPYESSMASDCLESWKGNTLIYVGEKVGMATANDDFFKILNASFSLIENVRIPQWPGLHDTMTVWSRKV
jgi:hypothetical protein